ncbi:HD domain-containing protein [Eubacterium oxidoreducens]|uniref:HDIG domain-containing protein n=1 Tax=Eubacterium oxidoreducens TaxID=1732 RepID=A0A1G6C4D0_EUBOX|nr:HD domain-containing protein [Eubacterium oxidoreducens]SDB27731.1 HDIG domain-containing protein [Eubacterium oxidoreducens]
MKNYAELLLKNESYRKYVSCLAELEKERKFCHHDKKHFIEVASLASWAASICRVPHEPQLIMLAALLHDIGRVHGSEHHAKASIGIAKELMLQLRVPEDLQIRVVDLIEAHTIKDDRRNAIKTYDQLRDALKELDEVDRLVYIFAWADNRVRQCFACDAAGECYWDDRRKNMEPINYEVFKI